MKKNIKLLFTMLALSYVIVMLAGCNKFLDRKPLTATLDDLNQGGLEGQIYGLYSNLRGSAGFTTIPWLAMHDFRSDDSEKGSDPSDGAEWVAPFDKFQYVKDLWASNQYWDDHYSLINLANTAIQTADSLKLSDASSLVNIAEAKFFRAFAYFDLVRTYGEVPKIDFRVYNASQANIKKSTTADIYALIDADLTYAAAHLPKVWGNQYPGRLTAGAAQTLQAKAYLFRGNWASAKTLAEQVMSSGVYSLYSSYYGIFKDAGENCSESIFEIQAYVSPNGTISNGCGFATTQGVRASTASGWNLGWGWNTPTDNLVAAYEAGDVRKGSTILFSGQSDDPSTGGYGRILPNSTFDVPAGPLPRKYWNKKIYADPAYRASTGKSDNPEWINKRIFRYADVVLTAAEAANELSATGADSVKIKELVNSIRTRAGLPSINYVNQATMRAAIMQERRVEFGVEGERFFDLVRWGKAVDVLGPLGYVEKCKYYPIPQPAIDKSGGKLIQNPDWQ